MLTIKNLKKNYGKRAVIKDLNLEIKAGEIYGLLGANGAGKTTTINIICNLIEADSGTIEINNKKVSQGTKKYVGVAPQENLLYKNLSCQENLKFYGRIYGLDGKKCDRRIAETLAAVNLSDRAKTPVESLSGGMKRRINIAIALIHEPKLVILDEPTTGLDIETRYEIWQLIEDLKKQGTTILLTTHLLDEAQRLCDRIGIIKEGKIIAEGSLNELRKLIPAAEIVIIKTKETEQAISRGKELGFCHRYYGNDLAFWLPEKLELRETLELFANINLESISRKDVDLEHIYLELTKNGI
ncbi:MAG: ABC transporter ATP-binding protein [Prochloraceae cyanobacterium]|nr:ABC transporter ATP-binding protein [Prochloraceae cyanobacterium]